MRKSRARYIGVTRVFAALSCVLFLLMIYVLLTASLTGLSYAVAKAQAQREALQEETMRLDDRIAALRSDDRLAALAARLGMRDPQQFAVVRVETPRLARVVPRLPMLSSLAGFFAPAVTRKQQ
jgi:cell division protein FtsB